jgi:hypothetical protein
VSSHVTTLFFSKWFWYSTCHYQRKDQATIFVVKVRPLNEFRRKSVLLVLSLAGLSQACARPDAFHRANSNQNPTSGSQKLPFHPSSDRIADDSERPAVPADPKPANSTPFRVASPFRTLPLGTLITVQLDRSFSLAKVLPGDSFSASLVGPIVVDGDILIARGTPVVGTIESTQPAVNNVASATNPSLIRLTLSSITMDGRSVVLQTSSLFAKGHAPEANASSRGFQLPKGHQLTFRLTSPVSLADANSLADRRYPDSAKSETAGK